MKKGERLKGKGERVFVLASFSHCEHDEIERGNRTWVRAFALGERSRFSLSGWFGNAIALSFRRLCWESDRVWFESANYSLLWKWDRGWVEECDRVLILEDLFGNAIAFWVCGVVRSRFGFVELCDRGNAQHSQFY